MLAFSKFNLFAIRRYFKFAILVLLTHSCFAFANYLYKPELENGNHDYCYVLNDFIQTRFQGRESNYFAYNKTLPKPFTPIQSSDKNAFLIGDENIYVFQYVDSGCGGACERYGVIASKEPDINPREIPYEIKKKSPQSQPTGISLFKSDSNRVFGVSEDKNAIKIYELNANAQWTAFCEYVLPSTKLGALKKVPPEVISTLEILKAARNQVAATGGQCGSMNTPTRWAMEFQNDLGLLLTRPWAIASAQPGWADYADDLENLEKWGVTEIESYRKYGKFLNAYKNAKNSLAHFYSSSLDFNDLKSNELAEEALSNVVGSSIRFFRFNPFRIEKEFELRKAVLDKKAISDIKNIGFDFLKYNELGMSGAEHSSDYHKESLLNIAVETPEILKYFLDKGLDPNEENGFGKTPLMYAVQHNQLESVKLLLAYGADVNSTTYIPWDHCFYTITTYDYTPLSYASRYASPNVINLLIESGASPYIQTKALNKYRGLSKYPNEWLSENPNLSNEEIFDFSFRLEPSADQDAHILARKLNQQAEETYAKGDVNEAFTLLLHANYLAADNIRIKNNLTLVALKASRYRTAFSAAYYVVKSDTTDKDKANAYFNIGLIGEKSQKETPPVYVAVGDVQLSYNAEIEAFLTAERLNSTPVRKSKIIEFIEKNKNAHCDINDALKITSRRISAHNNPIVDSPLKEGYYVFMVGPADSISNIYKVCQPLNRPTQNVTEVCADEEYTIEHEGVSVRVFKSKDYRFRVTTQDNLLICKE